LNKPGGKSIIFLVDRYKRGIPMAQKRLTITLPRSAEALHNALQMLLQYGLISERKVQTIECKRKQEEATRKPGKKVAGQ
jgi:hypothetical protein